LLRAIEAREVLPLGSGAAVPFEARLIAATNRDLSAEAAAGRFREDLYWRLSVFPLALAPLAQRPADILPLAARMLRGSHVRLSEAALAAMEGHDWPGNVRELGNRLERARILAGRGPLTDIHLELPTPGQPATAASLALSGQMRLHEADLLAHALAETGGRRWEAARRLGISERALRYKLAALAGRPRTIARVPA
jgi:DNA-binding NtrC family response regulator